jgi:hypothetical protein
MTERRLLNSQMLLRRELINKEQKARGNEELTKTAITVTGVISCSCVVVEL